MTKTRHRKQIEAIAREFNFTLKREGRHFIWGSPSGRTVVTGKTPSDHRALKNIRSMFRKEHCKDL
jgi:hypothetical protein